MSESDKTRLELVEEKVKSAYNSINSAESICKDVKLKSKLENEKDALYDILVRCEMIMNGDEEFTAVESSKTEVLKGEML